MDAPDRQLQGANRLNYRLSHVHRQQEGHIHIFCSKIKPQFVVFLRPRPRERSWCWLSQKAPGLESVEPKTKSSTTRITWMWRQENHLGSNSVSPRTPCATPGCVLLAGECALQHLHIIGLVSGHFTSRNLRFCCAFFLCLLQTCYYPECHHIPI